MRRLHLRRITSGGTWIPEIDGLRFVAIVAVLLFHIMGEMLERTGHPVVMQARYGWLRFMVQRGPRGPALLRDQRIHHGAAVSAAVSAAGG